MDSHLCHEDGGDCNRDPKSEVNFLRPMRFYLFDPSWTMLGEMIKNKDTTMFREQLLEFNDWTTHYNIVDSKGVDPNFWTLDNEQRHKPL